MHGAPSSSCVQPEYAAGLTPASNDDHIVIRANRADASLSKSGLSSLSGAVSISQRGRIFSSDSILYDDATKRLKMNAPALFKGPNFEIDSQKTYFDLNAQSGLFEHTKFTLPTLHGHGAADSLELARSGNAQLQHAYYTTCSADSEAWTLNARAIHLDQEQGIGTARNAVLRLGGVPVLWLPWFRFPLDGRRRSGLLYPTIAQGTKTGLDLSIPLYLNLAPNFDDEFTPRIMSRRGLQLNNTFRYLLPTQKGSFLYQYIGHDRSSDHTRTFIDLDHQGRLSDDLGVRVDFQQASDISYFDDFGGGYSSSSLADTSAPFLPRAGTLTFHPRGSTTSVQLLAESFQPLSIIPDPNDRPYKRLPELRVQSISRDTFYNVHAGFDGTLGNFERSDSITGQRLYLDPYLSWEMNRTAWFLSSRIDGTWTKYNLSNTPVGTPQNPQRALPQLSTHAGLRFDRVTDSGLLQTLEPHLFYLFVPYDNQNDLPVFDSGQPDFDFPALFARNRFTGTDRISDANDLTGVMTTRLIDPRSGLVKLSASAGLIYRFAAPRVTLPGVDNPSAGTSDYVGSLAYRYDRHWDISNQLQWNPNGNEVVRANSVLRYQTSHDQRLSLSYEYRQGLFNQADASFVLPIKDRWHVAGRLIYSFRGSSTFGAFGGLEYETCCWAIRGGARRYISNVNGNFSTGVFVQFTLKGLTRIGTGWENLLPIDRQDLRNSIRR